MMFSALKRATRTRGFATVSNHAFINAKRNLKNDFYKKNWLSDPSTYPLVLILGSALSAMVGVGASCLLYNPDVQIDPRVRGSVMRPEPLQGKDKIEVRERKSQLKSEWIADAVPRTK